MRFYARWGLVGSTAVLLGALTGCASTGANGPSARLVLYPNATLNGVGGAQGCAEAEACMARASQAGLTPEEKNNAVARGAGVGAATGAVASAVGALITGRGRGWFGRLGARRLPQ